MSGSSRPSAEATPPLAPLGKGYALWLVPEEPMFSLLTDDICRLSHRYSTPLFEPHVTLLSGITTEEHDTLEKTASLANSLKPLRLELDGVGYLDEYFRYVFIRVVPTAQVTQAHAAAKEAFGLQNKSPYMPHLSLVYGNLRTEEKKQITEDLGFEKGRIIEVRKLSLFRVSGAPHQWKCIEEFGLK